MTVLVLAFNHAAFIEQAIRSIWAQDFSRGVRIVVHDDCSTDGCTNILERLCAESPMPMKLIRPTENQFSKGLGFLASLLLGVDTPFVAFLEGDDFWDSPSKLTRQVEFLTAEADMALCHHRFRILTNSRDPSDHDWPPREFRRPLLRGDSLARCNYVGTLSVVARTECIPRDLAGYERLRIGDYPLWGLIADGRTIGYIDEPLGVYRIHENNYFAGQSSQEKADLVLAARLFVISKLSGDSRRVWLDAIARDLELPVEVERVRLASRVEDLGLEVLRCQAANSVLEEEINRLVGELVQLRGELAASAAREALGARQADRLEKELRLIRESLTWRLLSPFRRIARGLRIC